MPIDKVYSSELEGLPLQTGDIICTSDGDSQLIAGQFWRLIGKLIPGPVDHVCVYIGPGGRCVEAGAIGVIAFEFSGSKWDAHVMQKQRGGLLDQLYGISYPAESVGLTEEQLRELRIGVGNYCLTQAELSKPYNLNFFDSDTDGAFYCSQLAYKAYLPFGIDMNTGQGLPDYPLTRSVIFPQEIYSGFTHKRPSTTERF